MLLDLDYLLCLIFSSYLTQVWDMLLPKSFLKPVTMLLSAQDQVWSDWHAVILSNVFKIWFK